MEKEASKYKRAMCLNEKQFKRLVGVKKATAMEMLEVLQNAYNQKHQRRGRNAKLPLDEMMMMAFEYWRQYVTFFELAFEYCVAESTAHDIVVWVEDTLIKCGKFSLPGKKALLGDNEIEIVLVDVTESEIQRPKKNKSSITPVRRKNIP